jgi:hypothetical protein
MTDREPDFDDLVYALREDFPSKKDEQRMRKRLLAAGIGWAAVSVAPGASAALLKKLGALSWTVKLGLAGVAATAAVPMALYLARAESSSVTYGTPPAGESVPVRGGPKNSRATTGQPASAVGVTAPMVTPPAPVAPDPSPQRRDRSSAAVRERSTLAEETALVERALYALKRGDRDSARRTLEEHARRFPNGLLARERDRALLRANADDDGRNPSAPR